ncbi:hypothetical protein K523DRAFT_11496 [Schizophyllum commune Tattone D]|nr:hypothetical protein K523DRAFT_11496 [Schizophyllum commune Tattone D]
MRGCGLRSVSLHFLPVSTDMVSPSDMVPPSQTLAALAEHHRFALARALLRERAPCAPTRTRSIPSPMAASCRAPCATGSSPARTRRPAKSSRAASAPPAAAAGSTLAAPISSSRPTRRRARSPPMVSPRAHLRWPRRARSPPRAPPRVSPGAIATASSRSSSRRRRWTGRLRHIKRAAAYQEGCGRPLAMPRRRLALATYAASTTCTRARSMTCTRARSSMSFGSS